MTGVETVRGGVRAVFDGAQHDEIRADAVASCTGWWTAELLGQEAVPMLGPGRQEESTLGYIATIAPAPTRLSRVLTTPSLNIRPDGGGRLVLQSFDLEPEERTLTTARKW